MEFLLNFSNSNQSCNNLLCNNRNSDFSIWAKIRAKRTVDCPFGSCFSSKHTFAHFYCLSNNWGQRPFFNIRFSFLLIFGGVLEPNGQWKLSLPVWLSFQLEESIGGNSSKIWFLIPTTTTPIKKMTQKKKRTPKMKTTLKMPKNKDKPQKNANSKWRPQKVRQHKKYQFWQIIILELELSKISPP